MPKAGIRRQQERELSRGRGDREQLIDLIARQRFKNNLPISHRGGHLRMLSQYLGLYRVIYYGLQYGERPSRTCSDLPSLARSPRIGETVHDETFDIGVPPNRGSHIILR